MIESGKYSTKFIDQLQRSIQPTGGWVYHRRHFFNAQKWQPFKSSINLWLENNLKPADKLLLVGSSAGYNISDSFLKNYKVKEAIEIDPLGSWFWRMHHKQKIQTWYSQNYFGTSHDIQTSAFQNIRKDFPTSQILFCNLIGQLGFLYNMNSEIALKLKQELLMTSAPWASFHDLYSLRAPAAELQNFSLNFKNPQSRAEVLSILSSFSKNMEINDHWTSEILPELKNRAYFLWPLTKNSLHIVEAITHNC